MYYHGNIDLTKVLLKNDDLKEILGLYQEAGDNVYRICQVCGYAR